MSTMPAPALADLAASGESAVVQGSRPRGGQMAALRRQGFSLDEIAMRFGVSRERVRQILRAYGGPGRDDVVAARRRRAEQLAEERVDELLAFWRAGTGVRSLARELGLQTAACRRTIERYATDVDRAARTTAMSGSRVALTYSEADIILALTAAAARLGRVPSAKEYDAMTRTPNHPSLPTVLNRMGGWSNAVAAAGLLPAAGRGRVGQRRWTEEACWDALRRVVDEIAEIPSVHAYERVAVGRSDLPSAATIRNRLGRWSSLAARLAAQRELADQTQVRARSSAGALARA
jgi:transposase